MTCAVCGAKPPKNAAACPECGAELNPGVDSASMHSLMEALRPPASRPASVWSLVGWVIVGVAAIYYLAYSFALLPFPIYRVPSLYPVESPFASPALILAMILAITGGVILIAKFITGVRDRDARRVLGVAVGWALLIGVPFSHQGPWMLLAAAGVAAIAAFIYFNFNSRSR